MATGKLRRGGVAMTRSKIDWLSLEIRIREILRGVGTKLTPAEALVRIDAALCARTRRGCSLPWSAVELTQDVRERVESDEWDRAEVSR